VTTPPNIGRRQAPPSLDGDTPDAFASERQDRIAQLVEETRRSRVSDLARQFGVSAVTIRKDLQVLHDQGRLVRLHGGAVAVGDPRTEGPFESRERLQAREKSLIGAAAARMVADGESVALDASTTALSMARHLRKRERWDRLTVITNGLRIALELAGVPGITVVMPGGSVRWEAMSVVGPMSVAALDQVNLQKAFFGAAGFTLESGLSDATEEEAQTKRAMAGIAREIIAIVDHTKWGRAAFATFCPTNGVTTIITDARAPEDMVASIAARGIRVIIAEASGTTANDRSSRG
jgi:DeoR/GlpR family transcriptional regulator of sugar metabolism